MNIDFHVHGLLSKRKDFNENFFLNEIKYAKENKIDGIILCEHFNAICFNVIYKYLEENYIYEGNRYMVDGVAIFPALEVNVKGKGHVIIAGARDDIMDIHKILEQYMEKENLIEFEELLDMSDIYNCLKIGAHPCRKGHKLFKHSEESLKRLDAIDLNAKDIFRKGETKAKNELIELSKKLSVNIVTGSDSHTPLQIGAIFTTFNKECSTIEEIRKAIKSEEYSINISDLLPFKVYSSKVLKRYLMSTGQYNANMNFNL